MRYTGRWLGFVDSHVFCEVHCSYKYQTCLTFKDKGLIPSSYHLSIFACASSYKHTLSSDPLLTFEQTSYTLAEADSSVTYNLTISRAIQSNISFSIIIREVAGGTANVTDYSVPTDTFLFHPEVDSITIPITITGDDQIEPTETFLIQMTQESLISFSTKSSTISIFIEDDDGGWYFLCAISVAVWL